MGGGNILQICAVLLIASLISVMEIEPDDIFITSDNFRGFLPFIPGHIFDAFVLADAEPMVLQPCDSTVWVVGEPVVIAWEGAALSDIVVPRTVDSLRFMYDIPLWNCRIELYKEKEFVCDITHANSTPTLSRIDWTYPDDLHFYGLRTPVIELRERVDLTSRSDTYIYRRQHGTGYQIKLISFSIRSAEEIEIWSDPFEIVNPVLEAERIDGLSDVWDEFINSVERVFAPRARGYLAGRVSSNESGAPLCGYRVTVVREQRVLRADSSGRYRTRYVDTECISVTDSLGEYTLRLPEGTYKLTVRGDVHFASVAEGVRILADSTSPLNFSIQGAEFARFHWDTVSTASTPIRSTGSIEASTANTDPRIDELSLEDILEGSVSIRNEWLPTTYELSTTVIDIMDLGQPELKRAGLVKARVFFNESDGSNDWRVVLVYHEKVVVLEEDCEPSVFDLGLQTVNCTFSENGRYVIAFDAYGYEHRGADAVFLDTETGDRIRFDPSPQREYVDPYLMSTECRITVGNSHPLGHISNDGRYARLDGYPLSPNPVRFDLFNENMELVHAAFSDSVEIHDYTENYMSSDGSRICLLARYQDEIHLVIMNEEGCVLSIASLAESISSMGGTVADEDLSILMSGGSFSGVFIYSGQTGELLHHWHGSGLINRDKRVSPNGSYVSYFLTEDVYGNTFDYIVRSLPSADIPFDIELERESDSESKWFVRMAVDLANNGSSLLFIVQNSTGRYVLIDKNGLILWLSPVRRFGNAYMDFCYMSDNGMSVAYSDGYYIYILNLNHVSDY